MQRPYSCMQRPYTHACNVPTPP